MPKGWRKIHIDDMEFRYKFGKGNVVIIYPNMPHGICRGQKSVVDYSTLTGRSWDTIERGQWKRTGDGMVTPGHVKAHLEKIIKESQC